MKTALLAKAGLLATSGVTAFMMNAGTAHAAGYDNTDPSSTGCASGAITAKSVRAAIPGQSANALIELRYSPKCRTTWGRITTIGMPNCHTNDDWCGSVTLRRNSDGKQITCYTPNGTHGCYTKQLNDSGVTSYAFGGADNGAFSSYGRTGSY